MKDLGIELWEAKNINVVTYVRDLVAEYSSVFDCSLRAFKDVTTKITVQDNAKADFFNPRAMSFVMLYRVKEKLQPVER